MSGIERLLGRIMGDPSCEPLKCVICGSDDEEDLVTVNGVHMCSECRVDIEGMDESC